MNPRTHKLSTNTFLLLVGRVKVLIKHLGFWNKLSCKRHKSKQQISVQPLPWLWSSKEAVGWTEPAVIYRSVFRISSSSMS